MAPLPGSGANGFQRLVAGAAWPKGFAPKFVEAAGGAEPSGGELAPAGGVPNDGTVAPPRVPVAMNSSNSPRSGPPARAAGRRKPPIAASARPGIGTMPSDTSST